MPNRFQSELKSRNGVLNGRTFKVGKGIRTPIEIYTDARGVRRCNDIFTTPDQRAFAVLESAAAWRQLAAERLADGHHRNVETCKQRAREAVRHARRARIGEETKQRLRRAA